MTTPSQRSRRLRRADWFSAFVTVLIFADYLVEMTRYSRSQPLWLDEILTMWLVRLGSLRGIYDGLAKGAQYAPPGHPVLLLWWSKIFGASYLALRSPSFLGIALAAIAIFLLVRRSMEFNVAALAAVFVLCGPLHAFGQQMRPYALTVTCFAFALLLWEGYDRTPHPRWTLLGITLLLSAAITLHFYSILYLVSFAAIELMHIRWQRRIRWPVWAALSLAGLSVAIWIPLARHASRFNSTDNGPDFYAAPTFAHFAQSLGAVLFPTFLFSWIFLLLLMIVMVTAVIVHSKAKPTIRPQTNSKVPLLAIAVGCALLPFTTFVFARLVSGTYNVRYILPAAFCTVLLLCFAAERLPFRSVFIPLCSAAIAVHALVPRQVAPYTDNRTLLQAASKPYPIVFAEGLMFFQAEEDKSLTTQERSRMAYLTLPRGYPFKDPTNENLVTRWQTILPQLPAYPVEQFLKSSSCFYVFDSHKTADDLTTYLSVQGPTTLSRRTFAVGELDEVCPASQNH